jgi:hypothetical protein
MAQIVKVPIKTFSDGETWLLLEPILGKRVVMRAHHIDIKNNVEDYDSHHGPEAHAKESVKCKAKSWDISDKIVNI